jgi:DNA (cytosine-5)-methyltransferase 1
MEYMGEQRTKIKLIDLFAGAGGLSNGFEQTGRFEVAGAVEINASAAKTFIKNHDDNENIIIKAEGMNKSDITKVRFVDEIKNRNLLESDLVVIGGPPCQGFSNANRQKNYLISGNNQLIKEYVRAIEEIKPIAFVMENVKAIESKTHKFFVTEHNEETKCRYGSIKHLNEISNKKGNEIEQIWDEEIITLFDSNQLSLIDIIKEVVSGTKHKPIISRTEYIARLRIIEKTIVRNETILFIDKKELKEVNEIKKLIMNFRSNLIDIWEQKVVSGLSEIMMNAIDCLNCLETKAIEAAEVRRMLGPVIDLNKFLLHYNELIEEKIVHNLVLETSKDKQLFKVNAEVKSYNVVRYLEMIFDYLGYQIDIKILTASNFGVPQKRNRFVILGVRKDCLKMERVELPSSIPKIGSFTTKDGIVDLEAIHPKQDVKDSIITSYKEKKTNSLQKYYRNGIDNHLLYNHVNTKSDDLSIMRFQAIKDGGGKNFHSLSNELKSTYADISRTQNTIYLRLNYDEPSPTVVNIRKSMWNHPKNAVALSIREAARLQSFRDNYIFHGTKDQQYQQVGNAVPPLMARAIAETLLALIGDSPIIPLLEELQESKEKLMV